MTRDFSEKKRQELEKELDTVDKNFLEGLWDAWSDLSMRFGKWAGILNLDSYAGAVEEYHKAMLDMNNTTKKDLDKIFETVYDLDSEFGQKFLYLKQEQEQCKRMIEILSDSIGPSFTIASAATIKANGKAIKKEMKATNEMIVEEYHRELDYAETKAAIESVKGVGSGVLSVFGSIFSFTGHMAKREFAAATSDVWGLINATCKTSQNATALVTLAIGVGLSYLGGKGKYNMYEEAVSNAEDYSSRTGFTDELEGWGNKKLAAVSGTMDTVKETYDVIDTARGFVKPENAAKKAYTDADNLTKGEKISATARQKRLNKIASGASAQKKFISYMKDGKKIVEIASEKDKKGGIIEFVFDKSESLHDGKDIFEAGQGIGDWICDNFIVVN